MIAEHDADPEAHKIVVAKLLDVLAGYRAEFFASQAVQDAEIQLLKDTLIVDMEHRLLYMVGDLATIELREGVYNATLARIEC